MSSKRRNPYSGVGCFFATPFIGRVSSAKKQESFNLALHSVVSPPQLSVFYIKGTPLCIVERRLRPVRYGLTPVPLAQVSMCSCLTVSSLSTQFAWRVRGCFHCYIPPLSYIRQYNNNPLIVLSLSIGSHSATNADYIRFLNSFCSFHYCYIQWQV